MLALLTAVLLSGSGAALHVEKGLDAKLPCAANAALEQAIKVRLPRVRLARGRPAAEDLIAQISATAGGFRFEVRRADGSVAMSRDLFSGCAQLGDTSALILERYLAQISWAGRDVGLVAPSPPAPKPLPPPPVVAVEPPDAGPPLPRGVQGRGEGERAQPDAGLPESADLISRIGVAPEPSGNEVISSAPPPPATPVDAGIPPTLPVINLPPESPREPIVSAVEVSVGGGLWYGDRLVGGLSLDVGVVLRERVRLAVLALASTPHTRLVSEMRGSIESFDIGAFAMFGVCTKTALVFCGNAFGGTRVTWAAPSTDSMEKARLFQTRTGVITVPELGLLARVSYVLFTRLLLSLDVLVGVPLIRGRLEVPPYTPFFNPWIDAAALLRLGVRL